VIEAAKASESDFVIGIGRGSFADVARVIANKLNMSGKLVMVATITSMAGHISALSVIYNEYATWKRYDFSRRHSSRNS